MFVSCLGDWGSIPGWIMPKIQKMVLDAPLLNTQHYKVWVKGKWCNPGKGVVIENEAFGLPVTAIANLLYQPLQLYTNVYIFIYSYV